MSGFPPASILTTLGVPSAKRSLTRLACRFHRSQLGGPGPLYRAHGWRANPSRSNHLGLRGHDGGMAPSGNDALRWAPIRQPVRWIFSTRTNMHSTRRSKPISRRSSARIIPGRPHSISMAAVTCITTTGPPGLRHNRSTRSQAHRSETIEHACGRQAFRASRSSSQQSIEQVDRDPMLRGAALRPDQQQVS